MKPRVRKMRRVGKRPDSDRTRKAKDKAKRRRFARRRT
jgi:hypothetical protein